MNSGGPGGAGGVDRQAGIDRSRTVSAGRPLRPPSRPVGPSFKSVGCCAPRGRWRPRAGQSPDRRPCQVWLKRPVKELNLLYRSQICPIPWVVKNTGFEPVLPAKAGALPLSYFLGSCAGHVPYTGRQGHLRGRSIGTPAFDRNRRLALRLGEHDLNLRRVTRQCIRSQSRNAAPKRRRNER